MLKPDTKIISKNSIYSLIKYLIGWPLSLLALFFVLKLVSTNAYKALPSITSINYSFLFIGILCFTAYFFLRTYLWKYILADKGKHISFKKNALYWSTSELKRYIPGNIWSFLARTSSLEKEKLSKRDVFSFLTFEAGIVALSSFVVSFFYVVEVLKTQDLQFLFRLFFVFIIFLFIFSTKIYSLLFKNAKLRSIFNFVLLENSPFRNLKVLGLGILTFFMLGLGNYFSVISLYYLNLENVLALISLFTFSYFVGYISLITPMGLGVREGVMTIGLSSYIATSFAAVASIFSRIVFIASELIFLAILVFWNRLKINAIERMENILTNRKHEAFLVLFIVLYILYFTTASFLRFDNFYTGRFDLGNMDQTVWNTLNGRIFQLTDPDGVNTISRLSIHADFILILISPLYLIWSDPRMLLLFQTIVLSLGSVFVYLIAKQVVKDKNLSFTFAISYLLYPALGFVNLYDFHPVSLATTLLLSAFYFYIKKNYLLFTIFAVLAAFTKEQVWAIISLLGLYIFVKEILNKPNKNLKEALYGIILFVISVFAFTALIWKIIPLFKGGNHFALEYYSQFGSSASEVARNILLNPLKTFSTLTEGSRIYYLSQLFGPLGYLSLLFPILLIFAIPDLMINLLSANPQLHQVYYQYSSTITPFIFISAIYGAKILMGKFKILTSEKIAIYILITTLVSLYLTGPIAGSKRANIDMFTKQLENRVLIKKVIDSIPKNVSVASTNNLGSHLSRRENIYTIPYGMDRADVIVFLLERGYSELTYREQLNMIENLKNNPQFNLEFEDKNFYLFIKRNL